MNTLFGKNNNSVIKIGITGGIGSGKSTVTEVLKLMGFPIYNSDLRAAELMMESKFIQAEIRSAFGDDYFSESGLPDRKLLAAHVFNHPEALKILNSIIHPAVRMDFVNWCGRQHSSLAFKESAIIFEHGLEKELDQVWLVDAPTELRLSRVMKRGLSKEEVLARMKQQLSSEIKREKADLIIMNDEKTALIPQLITAIKSMKNQ